MSYPIEVRRTSSPSPHPDDSTLGFGTVFSDHVFAMDYDPQHGWHHLRIEPRAAISLDPAAAVLHYGQALFEGLKAFRGVDGVVRLFRVRDHGERLNVGAERLCMPTIEPDLFVEAVTKAVAVDIDWVPSSPGTALYLRPTLIATEPFLGVRAAKKYLFFVLLSPVGAYYAEGLAPVKIWIEQHAVRAARGGLGAVKAGANYAASLQAAEHAKQRGFAQVLWLDAAHHSEIEEVGTMNVFVRIGDEVITPPLGGSILGGMTRDSVLTLLKEWGVKATERVITVQEIVAAHTAGTLHEVFGSGTAAVISPVSELAGESFGRMMIGDGQIGDVAKRLFAAITAIQYGREPDRHGWLTTVTPAP